MSKRAAFNDWQQLAQAGAWAHCWRHALAAAAASAPAFKAGVFDPPRQAPDFSLRGSNGAELKLSDYRGKVVLLAFGYSRCLSVCPITLHTFAQALRQMGRLPRVFRWCT